MADAMVENRPAVRFFCHRCNMEFEDVLQDYKCPYCASGFIELLERVSNRSSTSGQTFSDANMSSTDDSSRNSTTARTQRVFPLNNIPPVLRDIAFLMSGGRLRDGNQQQPLSAQIGWTLSGGRGAAPPGTLTGGAPLVLLGTPGDYVFGGEALDAVVTQLLGQLEQSGPPPMPRDVIDSIPTDHVTEQQAATEEPCSICWENFQLGETVSKLVCEHLFHTSCITPWLQIHATCPVCRRTLLPERNLSASSSDTNTTSTNSTNSTNSNDTNSTNSNGATANQNAPGTHRPRPVLTPRVIIRRSTHPLFRRAYQTHTWDSPQNMSTSSGSSSSVTTSGLWAPQRDSSTSVDRTQNYHTDFDCD